MVGAMEDRGRLPGPGLLAISLPCSSRGRNEKSVSSLFSKNPATMRRDPNADSMVFVVETALPFLSTMEI
jgi:hypothetical protein